MIPTPVVFGLIGLAIIGLVYFVCNIDKFGPQAASAPATITPQPASQQFATFVEAVAEVLMVAPEQVRLEVQLDDLDADALDIVECVMALEEAFDIEVAEEELDRHMFADGNLSADLIPNATIGMLWELICSKLPAPAQPA